MKPDFRIPGKLRDTIICLLLPFLLPAQSVLTLPDALSLGEKNYPAVQAKQQVVNASQQDLAAVKKEYLPTLKLHEQLTYASANTVQGTFFPYGVVVPTSGGISPANNYTGTFGSISLGLVEWAPFSFGQYQSRVSVYRSQLDLAAAQQGDELFRHKIRIAEAYLNVLTLQAVEKASEENLARANVLQTSTLAAARNGLRPGADTSFADAEVSKAKLQLIDAQQNEATAKLYLAMLIGSDQPDFAMDTTLLSKLPSLAIDTVKPDITKTPLAAVYRASVDVSMAKEENIRRSVYPKVSVLGGMWGRGSGMGAEGGVVENTSLSGAALTRYNYGVGVAVTFNAFDFYRIHSQWEAEHFRTAALQDDYQAALLQLREQQSAAELGVRSAIARMNEAPVQLNAARALYNQTNARYQSGLATGPDLAQALYNVSRAEDDMVNASDGLWRALLMKAAADGNLDEFISRLK